jgi:hypothetical protein
MNQHLKIKIMSIITNLMNRTPTIRININPRMFRLVVALAIRLGKILEVRIIFCSTRAPEVNHLPTRLKLNSNPTHLMPIPASIPTLNLLKLPNTSHHTLSILPNNTNNSTNNSTNLTQTKPLFLQPTIKNNLIIINPSHLMKSPQIMILSLKLINMII